MKTQNIYSTQKKQTVGVLEFVMVLLILIMAAASAIASPRVAGAPDSFKAYCNNNHAVIQWQVKDNEGVYYSVERTQDGVNYELVTDVQVIPGKAMHQYEVVDPNPLRGVSYYRITVVSDSGVETYLNTATYSSCEAEEFIDVADSENKINVMVNTKTADSCTIVLKNAGGKVVFSINQKVSAGANEIVINPKLEKDTYMINVTCGKLKLNEMIIMRPGGNK